MSTFGGDSWVPENLYRKRRVAELLGEDIEEDEVKLLSNGKLACLLCPNRPVLDTMPMLHIHRKGTRHQTAAENLREKSRRLQEEIQKRIALGSGPVPSTIPVPISTLVSGGSKNVSPLLTTTKMIKDAVLRGQADGDSKAADLPGNLPSPHEEVRPYVSKRKGTFFRSQPEKVASSTTDTLGIPASPQSLPQKTHKLGSKSKNLKGVAKSSNSQASRSVVELDNNIAMQELRRVTQRELKWKEAGWRRDGAGGWSKDENVEFDSDEDIPVDDLELPYKNETLFGLEFQEVSCRSLGKTIEHRSIFSFSPQCGHWG